MPEPELVDEALALLSVAIGTILEDHADAAVQAIPSDPDARAARFAALRRAGSDIVALAEAAEALLRRSV